MKLLDVYALYGGGEITDEGAAEALQMSTRTWRFHLKRHGHRLPLIFSILDKMETIKAKVRKGSPPLDKAEDKDEPND